MKSTLLALAILGTLEAHAAADAFVRVIAQRASVRSGPGASYREVFVAPRDTVMPVLERGSKDYWFKVELEDGTNGWILGDLVFPFEVGEEEEPGALVQFGRAFRRTFLGPSAVPYANVGISFSAGLLDREGVFFFRPSVFLDEYWSIEAFGGLNPRSEKDVFMGGLGFVLRMAPGAVIGPYANLSLGAAYIRPKADNPIDMKETLMAMGAGGGFEITFKKQITLRLDARNWTFFDQNKATNGQEYSGGLAIFF